MVIADTGFWLALASRRDVHHQAACLAMKNLEEAPITTWPVLTETCHLFLHRLGHAALLRFVRSWNEGALQIFTLKEQDLERIGKLMKKYADLPMDLADASLVMLADYLGHGRILTTDLRDFRTYRWKSHRPFENLLVVK